MSAPMAAPHVLHTGAPAVVHSFFSSASKDPQQIVNRSFSTYVRPWKGRNRPIVNQYHPWLLPRRWRSYASSKQRQTIGCVISDGPTSSWTTAWSGRACLPACSSHRRFASIVKPRTLSGPASRMGFSCASNAAAGIEDWACIWASWGELSFFSAVEETPPRQRDRWDVSSSSSSCVIA